jgi:hypothetical protein
MQFSVVTDFTHDAQTVWKTVTSLDFIHESNEYSGVMSTILSEDIISGKRKVVSRIDYRDPLPKAAAKVLGKTHLSYTMEQLIDDEKQHIHWNILLPELGRKFNAKGTFTISDTTPTSKRIINGNIQVRVPLFGAKIEREIIKKLESAYQKTGDFTKKYLENLS